MNLIGYVRVSTSEQGESGLGLEAQRAQIEAAAAARGAEIVGWFEDVQSGGDFGRPGLQNALGWLRPQLQPYPPDGLIVAKLDRLARSVVDFGLILRRAEMEGWSIVALDLGVDTTTAAGRLVANVLMAVAQWEREIIGERTKAALAAKAARGEQVGRAPEIPEAAEDAILRMRENGVTFAKIAQLLNDEDFETARGGRWSTSTVVRVCERARRRHDLYGGFQDGSDS
jgi:DNA invertase Pin-like site-specific DNA recombinase